MRSAAWLDRVDERARAGRPDWLVWHYSVFSYASAGLPIAAPVAARRLAATGVPVVGILHELAYPFGRSGARGLAYALTQRAALHTVCRHVRAAVLTTDDRAAWLDRAHWLPRRRTTVLPVCSNVAFPSDGASFRGS